jgi:hypothetical protein
MFSMSYAAVITIIFWCGIDVKAYFGKWAHAATMCSDGVPSIFYIGVLLLAVLAEDLSA